MESREPQYSLHLDLVNLRGRSALGLGANATWNIDPARLTFVLSRYKFVARMLEGQRSVLEVGCGDGFASRIVRQRVHNLTVSDFDPLYVGEAEQQLVGPYSASFLVHDFTQSPIESRFSAIYLLDVLEHVPPESEPAMLANLVKCLESNGVMLIGVPSLESQVFASPASRKGHVNCKTGSALKTLMESYFENVFIFSMNDEVVHTGFWPMAHYLIALCVTPRP